MGNIEQIDKKKDHQNREKADKDKIVEINLPTKKYGQKKDNKEIRKRNVSQQRLALDEREFVQPCLLPAAMVLRTAPLSWE